MKYLRFFLLALLITGLLSAFLKESNSKSIGSIEIEKSYCNTGSQTAIINWDIGNRKAIRYNGMIKGTDYIGIEGMESYSSPGKPQLPGEIIPIELPHNCKIQGAQIINGNYVNLDGEYDICPKPEQFPRNEHFQNRGTIFNPDATIYNQDGYYPGNWLKVWGGNDAHSGKAFVQLMPLQFNPISGELVLLKEAQIKVYYEIVEKSITRIDDICDTDAECIIIGPEEFRSSAFPLISDHELAGISTDYISLDSIASSYEPAALPEDFPYYHDSALPSYFSGYDINLALRIIAYLNDDDAHNSLQNIVLLGDAHIIPPSFYSNFGYRGYWDYYIPSDFLYSSPDYDIVANYGVSRLPADTPCEAGAMCARITYYNAAATPDLFDKIYFTGGNPFDNYYFDDEMTPNHIINAGNTMGFDVKKSFATRGGFSKEDFIREWSSGDYGFVYEMGHGDGYAIAFDDGDDFDTEDFFDLPPNHFAPIHFVGVCTNGMFDDELIVGSDSGYTYAEAALYSAGGAIAVLAATRTSTGTPTYYFDEAKLVVESEEYIADMGFRIIEALNRRPDLLGDLMLEAQQQYVESNDMTDPDNLYTLYEFILFGDAAMALPFVPIEEPGIVISIDYPEIEDIHLEFPIFSGETGDFISFTPDNYSDRYNIGLSRIFYDGYVDTSATIFWGSSFDLLLKSHSEALRMDIADQVGFEERLYFWASGSRMFTDGYDMEWSSTPIAASDPDDFENQYLELTELYIRDDVDNYYFSFPVYDVRERSIAFNLAIDSKEGGYTGGDEEHDFDSYGNQVFFGGGYEVDFIVTAELWSYPSYDYYVNRHDFGVWDGAAWSYDYQHIGDLDGEIGIHRYSENGFVEIRLPKASVENYDSLAVILYSTPIDVTGMNHYPAQDAVPDDPATFDTLAEGFNTLTNFHVYRIGEAVGERAIIPNALSTITASPNPFNSVCRMDFGNDDNSFSIIDISGKIVFQSDIPEYKSFIWVPQADISSGIYKIITETSSASILYIK